MNLRNVLRAYSLLRQLSDDESALLNILRELNDSDREHLITTMGDKPQKKPTERTIEHCAACDYTRRAKVHKDATAVGYHEFQPSSKKPAGKGGGGKSKHASSLQQQIKGAAKGGTDRPLEALCVADLPNGAGRCGHEEDDPLHSDTSYGNAHTYQPPATHAATGD